MKIRIITLLIALFCTQLSICQRNMADSAIGTTLLGVQYGLSWTGGDLAERYGMMNTVGLTAGYKFRSNWYVGIAGDFLFGRDINMDLDQIFGNITDKQGYIIDINGDQGSVLLFSRGFHANIEVGRVFSKLGHNANSGVMLKIGGGYLNHRMRIETNDHVIPSIELDYKRGYDRLTTGFNTSQFLGYLFMADNSFLNFYGGIFIQEGFTYNRRKIFYDAPNTFAPTEMRMDILYGFKVGWLIPIYQRKPKEYYFN